MKHARLQTLAPMPLGLQDRQGQPSHASFTPLMTSWVINAYWSDLQPVSGGPLVTNTLQAGSPATAYGTLDSQVTAARTAGARIRLRIFGGIYAPSWAKALGGGAMSWDAGAETMGRWWTSAYVEACRVLNMLLAAKYDDDPVIGEVTLWGPMTTFAEPMIRQTSDATSRASLIAAGYTKASDMESFYSAFDQHEFYWNRTRTTLAANPFQWVDADGSAGDSSTEDADTLMSAFRSQLLHRAVLGNNSLRYQSDSDVLVGGDTNYSSDPQNAKYFTLWNRIRVLGAPIYFQTATAAKIGSVIGTLENALHYGASSVELNTAYDDDLTGADAAALTTAEFTSYDASLKAKARWS